MNYEQKSCDSFRLRDFLFFYLLNVCVRVHARVRAFSGQMKNQYIFRVIHIQCPQRFRPDGERERGGVAGWGV